MTYLNAVYGILLPFSALLSGVFYLFLWSTSLGPFALCSIDKSMSPISKVFCNSFHFVYRIVSKPLYPSLANGCPISQNSSIRLLFQSTSLLSHRWFVFIACRILQSCLCTVQFVPWAMPICLVQTALSGSEAKRRHERFISVIRPE